METIQPMVLTPEFQRTKVNNVSITCIENINKKFIPIKPICEALDIDVESQRKKIYDDEGILDGLKTIDQSLQSNHTFN